MAQPLVFANIEGGPELIKALKQIGDLGGNAKTIVRSAQRKALRPVEATAKKNAPFEFGDLRDDIAIRTLPRRLREKFGDETLAVGQSSDGFYGLFHEYGWTLHTHGARRRMPATPYLRPAWDQHKASVFRTMRTEIWKGIARAATRASRRIAKAQRS